ncbi:MAG TPA: methyltransferase domain-containing protein [Candidatus Merdenecus merdavium]|nr:methyltransferase domain-containing protein [Candidatus Merdenecus merdavium]
MLKNISTILQIPEIYEKTESAFWEDEYISKKMLENHLNPNFDGASRNLKFIEDSVHWIKDTIPPSENKLLLDVGCGPGIYTELFEKRGYQVTGVDFSRRSINYARESATNKNLNVSYVCQNYLALNLPVKFDVITMIYCDYGALSIQDRKTLTEKIYHHLKPGGKFLLDVFSVGKFNTLQEQQVWDYSNNNGFWCNQPYLALNRCLKYPENVALEQTSIITKDDIITYNLWTTYFTEQTLAEEFINAGFKRYRVFSDVRGTPYDEKEFTLALILEK